MAHGFQTVPHGTGFFAFSLKGKLGVLVHAPIRLGLEQVGWGGTEVEPPAEFERSLPRVRDLVLTLLTSRSFEEIRTPEGKQRLREDIVDRVNHAFEGEVCQAVYFTEFVVQ